MKDKILSHLHAECPWRDTLYWYPHTDSTNTQAKLLAARGAPQGTVLVAGRQTGGRGRMGRSFLSPQGQGVYLSVILRPGCPPEKLMHLTCAAGVAAARAVEAAAGISPQLKWINDLVIREKKLGGILTEMSLDRGLVDYAVVGIGINCLQGPEDFPPELAPMATSLSLAAGRPIQPEILAAALTESLWQLSGCLLTRQAQLMEDYRRRCVTLGKDIQVISGGQIRPGKALELLEDGALLVQYPDGSTQAVASGEVSVRGMYGYV